MYTAKALGELAQMKIVHRGHYRMCGTCRLMVHVRVAQAHMKACRKKATA